MTNEITYTPSGTGKAIWFFGDKFTFLVTGAESGGSYSTLESLVAPGNGPVPHIHHNAEEQFYVLEGNICFSIGDQTFHATAGDFVHIPRGTVHSFKNESEKESARLLATFSPAGMEEFFIRLGEPATDGSMPSPITPDWIARAAAMEADYGMETLPPEDH